MKNFLYSLFLLLIPTLIYAEDGSKLWLRYQPLSAKQVKSLSMGLSSVVSEEPGDCTTITELQDAWKQLTGKELPVAASLKDYSLVIGTEKSKLIQSLGLQKELQTLGSDGFIIRTMKSKGNKITVIASKEENGLLYAVFNLIRNIQLYVPSSNILRTIQLSSSPFYFDIKEVPTYKIGY
jgi:Alpha-glucuronidase